VAPHSRRLWVSESMQCNPGKVQGSILPPENLCHAVALHYMYYNFCPVHQTFRVSPAMEAGIADHVWSIEELCDLLPQSESAIKRIDKWIILKAQEKNQHEWGVIHDC
jgi:hypothetical protein